MLGWNPGLHLTHPVIELQELAIASQFMSQVTQPIPESENDPATQASHPPFPALGSYPALHWLHPEEAKQSPTDLQFVSQALQLDADPSSENVLDAHDVQPPATFSLNPA